MIIALVLILGGGFFANLIQTGGYDIDIRDVRFAGTNGIIMSALLYVPEGVTAKNKAPGIVAIHGYINSRETQDGFAIEYARRGYVVLALDQTGHGYSDPPAFANGYGGIDGLKYLRTLDFVDAENIGLEGHSMGGWASAIAASVIKDGYKSFVMASSSTGTFGAPDGTATYPRNMALIFSEFDEFSGLMWGAPVSKDIVTTDKLKTLFNTTETVEVGKLYGSIEEGTARKLYQPPIIHPKVHFSTEAIGNAIEWMQMTLKGGNDLPPSDQTWYWKEFFTFLALIGMIILIFPVGGYLLQTDYFKELSETPDKGKPITGRGWWVGAVITVLVPIPVYLLAWSFHSRGIAVATYIWPQWITTTVIYWALGVAIVSLVLFLLWHFLSNKKKGAGMSDYGLTWSNKGLLWKKIGKSFLLAFVVVFIAHLSLVISDWAFQTDYRLWVFAIKPLDALHFGVMLGYIIPFAFYFLVLGVVLHGQMRPGKEGVAMGFGKEAVINIILLIAGYFIFLLIHYIPLFAGGTLALPDAHLSGIVLFQFIPIFTIVGLITTYFYRKTGHIYVGAFLSTMLVTWIVVAGQAIHYAY
jgi:pimeloyl-ACP methyl ester carboxylesterase